MFNYVLINILGVIEFPVCLTLVFIKITHRKLFKSTWISSLFNMIFSAAIQTKNNDLTIFNTFLKYSLNLKKKMTIFLLRVTKG